MINLLPPKQRLAMDVAKRNTVLRRYVEFALLAMLLLALLIVGSYYFLSLQASNTQKTLDLNNQKLAKLEPVQKDAEQLSVTISTIAALFSREVDFSKMLTQIGQLMPEKTVLAKLELSSVDSKAPLNITAEVDSEEKAAVLRNNLASSSLFDKANIISITKIGDDTESSQQSGSTAITPTPSISSPTTTTEKEKQKDSPYKFAVVIEAYFKDAKAGKQ